MAIFGIECNTDPIDPQSTIRTFQSPTAAIKWREAGRTPSGHWPRAYADKDNFHHRIREVYDTGGQRITNNMAMALIAECRGSVSCPRTKIDAKASLIRQRGVLCDQP